MRFLDNGPSIPDDLLIARDESRVVFFCGAGVSRARAKLPDFFGLANNVIQQLGVSADSPACKILKEANEIGNRTGVTGLISADRRRIHAAQRSWWAVWGHPHLHSRLTGWKQSRISRISRIGWCHPPHVHR